MHRTKEFKYLVATIGFFEHFGPKRLNTHRFSDDMMIMREHKVQDLEVEQIDPSSTTSNATV